MKLSRCTDPADGLRSPIEYVDEPTNRDDGVDLISHDFTTKLDERGQRLTILQRWVPGQLVVVEPQLLTSVVGRPG